MNIEEIVEKIRENPIESKGHLYHPIPFEEFKTLTTSSDSGAVIAKWKRIKNTIIKIFGGLNSLNVLDVGANAGFYTFSFAKEGARVRAYENHPGYKDLGVQLANLKKLPVEWIPQAFNSKSLKTGEHFQIALLLSVYQWMAEGDIKNREAMDALKHISEHSDYLFFELGFNHGKSCVKTSKLNHYAEMIHYLQQHTSYSNFKLIGKTRLWKSHKRYLILCSNNPDCNDHKIRMLIRKLRF